MTLTCTITHPTSSYDIAFCHSVPSDPSFASYIRALGKRVVIITDDQVATLYGKPLQEKLSAHGVPETLLCSFPPGESFKTRETKQKLEDEMFSHQCGKDTVVIAIGGGIVTDVGGYVAATYCRGIPHIMIPTTLLGMVDASIGGKTGLNTPFGKNLIGCIYQPKRVYIDLSTLLTLPQKNVREGIVEMIKHGVIADSSYLDYLEHNVKALLALELPTLEHAIAVSCRIKKEIVEEDEQERGKRVALNLGHTIAHALETLSKYTLSHGEAVAIGILAEAKMAVDLNLLPSQSLNRIESLFSLYSIPTLFSLNISTEEIWEAMLLDKKATQKTPRFLLLERIGSFPSLSSVERRCFEKAFDWVRQ